MRNNPKIFVIIVTYKGGRWYDKCFGSLRESTMPLQVVAVDNSPGNEDAEYIKTHYPEVHLIKTNENLGFGRANNLGMRYALNNGCDYVFLLNQDAWIENDTINDLVNIHYNNNAFAILSPLHINPKSNQIGMLLDDGHLNYSLLKDSLSNQLKSLYKIQYVNAAAWLLPRNTLEIIGGFCPLIYHFGEDDDYMSRIHYHGMTIGLCPKTRVYHDSGAPLEGREQLRARAQKFNYQDYLNLREVVDLNQRRIYLLRKILVAFFTMRKKDVVQYFEQYNFLKRNFRQIEYCRKQHMIKQSNWLLNNYNYNGLNAK